MKKTLLIGLLCTASATNPLAAGWGQSEPQKRVGTYDFSYFIDGASSRIRPVQVFDDGRQTFFQFQYGAVEPAIFVVENGRPALLPAIPSGQYLVVQGTYQSFALQLGTDNATVRYDGPRAPSEPAKAAGGQFALEAPAPARIAAPETVAAASAPSPRPAPAAPVSAPAPTPPTPAVQPAIAPASPESPISRPIAEKGKATPLKGDSDAGAAVRMFEVPFAVGKAQLGQQGRKVLDVILAVGRTATEIQIVAPLDPDAASERDAWKRADELERALRAAGLRTAKFSQAVSKAVADDKGIVSAQVKLHIPGPATEPPRQLVSPIPVAALPMGDDASAVATTIKEIVFLAHANKISGEDAAELIADLAESSAKAPRRIVPPAQRPSIIKPRIPDPVLAPPTQVASTQKPAAKTMKGAFRVEEAPTAKPVVTQSSGAKGKAEMFYADKFNSGRMGAKDIARLADFANNAAAKQFAMRTDGSAASAAASKEVARQLKRLGIAATPYESVVGGLTPGVVMIVEVL